MEADADGNKSGVFAIFHGGDFCLDAQTAVLVGLDELTTLSTFAGRVLTQRIGRAATSVIQ